MPHTDEDDDTIVVKGEYSWANPSSPSSISRSSEIEPLGANLLAQSNTPQHLESPEPLEEDNPTQSNSSFFITNRTPSTSKRQRTNVPTMEERLQAMPEKRPLPWRDGVEPGAEIETGGESRRKQIRFGCLLATRGDIAPVPCNSCANGRGKFNVCVALEGYFKGACASCQLSGRPNRCSIKQSDDAQSPHVDTPNAESFGSEQQRPPSATLNTPASRPPKRRRTNEVPEWENTRPQWQQELGDSHARQQMNESVLPQRPWTTVNAPAPSVNVQMATRNVNGSRGPQRNIVGQPTMTWAAVNQPAVAPAPAPAPAAAPAAVLPPTPLPINNGMRSNGNGLRWNAEQERREGTEAQEEGSKALIDTFQNPKKRKIYGVISGLQSGIEHLQRELDSLKRLLGIDDED